jgi:hypothetical protein
MIILHRDGSLTTDAAPKHVARLVKDTIEVPEDLVAQQPDLIDRIFALAFDELDLKIIDVRIRPVSLGGYSGTGNTVPCI